MTIDSVADAVEPLLRVLVLSPRADLYQHVLRCLEPRGFVVVGAPTVEDARRADVRPHVVAVDGEILRRCAWRGRELAETLLPRKPLPLLGLVHRDAHRPPPTFDGVRSGIIPLFEPFLAPELVFTARYLAIRAMAA